MSERDHECAKCKFTGWWRFVIVAPLWAAFLFNGCPKLEHGPLTYERRIQAIETQLREPRAATEREQK